MKSKTDSLTRKLRQYSLMTSPILASAGFASGQIVYTDVHPDLTITSDSGTSGVDTFDLNNDGVFDFIFGVDHSLSFSNGKKFNFAGLRIFDPSGNNGFMGYTSYGFFRLPNALNAGDNIGPDQVFQQHFYYYASCVFYYLSGATFGQWNDVTNKYLGFELAETDGFHYGWVRMDVFKNPPKMVIKDYAYNAVPGLAISAGATPQGCADIYEPNDHKSDAASIGLNTTISANINSPADHDWYSFDVNGSENNLRIVLSDLPSNYNMGLFKGDSRIAYAHNSKKTNDTIVVNGASAGTYQLVVASSNGKFSSSKCYSLTVESSSSPFKLITDANEEVASSIKIYPNPVSDEIKVDLTQFENTLKEIQLMDQFGKLIYRNKVESSEPLSIMTIECKTFPSGMYVLSAISDKGVIMNKISIVH